MTLRFVLGFFVSMMISQFAFATDVPVGSSIVVCAANNSTMNNLLVNAAGLKSGNFSIAKPFSVSAPAINSHDNSICLTLTKQ